MKPIHIRVLAGMPVIVFSVANMPPFVHLWSDALLDGTAVAALVLLYLSIAMTGPFNRWMLDKSQGSFDRWILALGFSIGTVGPLLCLLIVGAAHASRAIGLHGLANFAVALVTAVTGTVLTIILGGLVLGWTERRTDVAYRAAFPYDLSDDDVDLSE